MCPMPAPAVSPSNVIADPAQTLQRFDLLDLAQYTQEKSYATNASKASFNWTIDSSAK